MANERRTTQYRTNGNAAYQPEYSGNTVRRSARPDPRRQEPVRRPRVQPRTQPVSRPSVEVRKQSAVAPFAIVGFIAVALCALMLVMTSARLAVVKNETVELRSTLSELKGEEQVLLAQYELAFDLAAIKEGFTSNGSMVEANSGQTVYLDLSEGDNVIYYEAAHTGLSGFISRVEQFLADLMS